jgi:hypothetical protein
VSPDCSPAERTEPGLPMTRPKNGLIELLSLNGTVSVGCRHNLENFGGRMPPPPRHKGCNAPQLATAASVTNMAVPIRIPLRRQQNGA